MLIDLTPVRGDTSRQRDVDAEQKRNTFYFQNSSSNSGDDFIRTHCVVR